MSRRAPEAEASQVQPLDPRQDLQRCAEEVARYDAILFGACGEPHLNDLRTLARIFDVDPGELPPGPLWSLLRPMVTGA